MLPDTSGCSARVVPRRSGAVATATSLAEGLIANPGAYMTGLSALQVSQLANFGPGTPVTPDPGTNNPPTTPDPGQPDPGRI